MKVIHDDVIGGFTMIPLMLDWRISPTCEIRDCTEKSNAIYCFNATESPTGNSMHLGICEKHHKESKKSGKFHYTVDR